MQNFTEKYHRIISLYIIISYLFRHVKRRRAAGVAIHGLVSLKKFFPGTAILIQPELQQNKNAHCVRSMNSE